MTEDATDASSSASMLAAAMGYLIGAGSLLLYTPIAFRVYRQKSADGLVLLTWWLKLGSYVCSDIYYFTRRYDLSTFVETLTITVESAVVLFLVAYYQGRLDLRFGALASVFILVAVWLLTTAPPNITALGQVSSAALNSGALMPQFRLNFSTQSKGDYSPLTATLASIGCAIRLFTTTQLNGSDPILLWSFGVAFVLNSSLLLQILYYGVLVEGLSVLSVFAADLGQREQAPTCNPPASNLGNMDDDDQEGVELFYNDT